MTLEEREERIVIALERIADALDDYMDTDLAWHSAGNMVTQAQQEAPKKILDNLADTISAIRDRRALRRKNK